MYAYFRELVILFVVSLVLGDSENKCDNECGTYCYTEYQPIQVVKALMQKYCKGAQEENEEESAKSRTNDVIKNNDKKPSAKRVKTVTFQRFPNDEYYFFEHQQLLSWYGAELRCRQLGAHLVDIANKKELAALVANLHYGQNYWTDITDLSESFKYKSFTSGKPQVYVNWHENEPNNLETNEHCVELRSRNLKILMNDNECDKIKNYICKL